MRMDEMKSNATKVKILSCLRPGTWQTSHGIARRCGLSLTDTSELLRRYWNQGIVTRVRNYGVARGYWYRITSAGLARLRYLKRPVRQYEADRFPESGISRAADTLADRIGLVGEDRGIFAVWVNSKLGG